MVSVIMATYNRSNILPFCIDALVCLVPGTSEEADSLHWRTRFCRRRGNLPKLGRTADVRHHARAAQEEADDKGGNDKGNARSCGGPHVNTPPYPAPDALFDVARRGSNPSYA